MLNAGLLKLCFVEHLERDNEFRRLFARQIDLSPQRAKFKNDETKKKTTVESTHVAEFALTERLADVKVGQLPTRVLLRLAVCATMDATVSVAHARAQHTATSASENQ